MRTSNSIDVFLCLDLGQGSALNPIDRPPPPDKDAQHKCSQDNSRKYLPKNMNYSLLLRAPRI
jgi:hypothetical protein